MRHEYVIARIMMSATYLVFDQRSEGEVIEEIREVSPHIGIAVLPQALVVEPIHLRDLPRLVVASEDGDTVAVAQFEGNKEGDGFDGVIPPVDIITHEEVVGVGRVTANAKELREVVLRMSRCQCLPNLRSILESYTYELTMNISADGHRTPHRLDV